MKVKIKIDSNLRINKVFEPPLDMELQEGKNTLQDVLQKLYKLYPYLKFIDKGEMGDDLRNLYLNGKSHFTFSEGLMKKVNEGDIVHVEAYMDPLAGG